MSDVQVNAETPGAIHEGGELGYCLAVAYGSVMDKPDAITVAVIGDGESETGPTATAWHAHKVSHPLGFADVVPRPKRERCRDPYPSRQRVQGELSPYPS